MLKDNLTKNQFLNKTWFPKIGDLVEGKVIEIKRNEVYLDLNSLATGVVRGPELEDELNARANLKIGDTVSATVIDLDNEKGLLELSFRITGHQKAWQKLKEIMAKKQTIPVKIISANTGGLIVQYGKIDGFLPTSQLSYEHFPRVPSGDRNQILNLLKKYIGQTFQTKIIGLSEDENRLIVSEKEVTKETLGKGKTFKIGDIIEGEVQGLVDFGAFIRFNGQEGLCHISEIAWRRLDHPSDVLKVGDKVKAEIIDIKNDKFSLSIKKLIPDPWLKVCEKYHLNQEVIGKILKINPFGFFVEISPEIHGLAHVSELSENGKTDPYKIAKVGDILKFRITSIEP
ncbi:MAG: 30S ribosomal protein S1, partial [Minisyncoccia bacterium]